MFIFIHVAMTTAQLNHQKTKVCVVNLLAAIFGDRGIKGFRENGE